MKEREKTDWIDGRLSLESLYGRYFELIHSGWRVDLAYYQESVPVWSLVSPKWGRANWIIAGIHGEEPAGPNAIAESVDFLRKRGQERPVVLYPMCNPVAYRLNWRYFNEYRNPQKGKSVGDAIHYLTRDKRPTSRFARDLTAHIVHTAKAYPPEMVIDLHEDEDITAPYFYFYGKNLAIPRIAIGIAERAGLAIQKQGVTDKGERIHDGVVINHKDNSIDELLYARRIRADGRMQGKVWVKGPSAESVLVVETPVLAPLKTRIAVHKEILRTLI